MAEHQPPAAPTQLPDLRLDGQNQLRLSAPYALNEGVQLNTLQLTLQASAVASGADRIKQSRSELQQLSFQVDRQFLAELMGRSLSGGGLSDLQIQVNGVRITISGILSREGRRTPFLTRGFLLEEAGPYGGVVFHDVRLFGLPGLPAPAMIPLLVARTGRHGPVQVSGTVTLQFNPLSLLMRYGLATAGWKVPSYRQVQLHRINSGSEHLALNYGSIHLGQPITPAAQQDPNYKQWMALRTAEQMFIQAESLIGRGEYEAAIHAYEDELWLHPEYTFVQERLMQLYIASPQRELWAKSHRLAEERLRRDPRALSALNCLAQYAEGIQDFQMASHYYTQMGEAARQNGERVEAALSFGKAAELLEGVDGNKAWQLWQQTRKEQPTYRPAIAALARHALKAGQYPEAESILRELIDQTPPSIERARYHLSLAGLYRSRLRDLNNARQQLELAAPYLSEDIAYQRELAEFRLATDENLDALYILDRLSERVQQLNHFSLYAEILFRTGQILEERLTHPGASLQRYRKVLQFKPEHRAALHRMANLQAANVQEEEFSANNVDIVGLQIEEKERALRQNQKRSPGETARLHLELAQLHWQRENADRALYHGNQALQFQSSLESAWQLLEEVCVRTNRQQELASIHREMAQKALFDLDACRHLEEALRLQPQDIATLEQLSQRYQKLQQWDKLDVLYDRWLEATPDDIRAPIWLKKGQSLEHNLQRLAEAEVAYLQAYQNAQDRLPYVQMLIEFYIRHNQRQKLEIQIDHLAGQLKNPTEKAAIYAELGQVLQEDPKRQKQALAVFQQALSYDQENIRYLYPSVNLMQRLSQQGQFLPPEGETHPLISLLERLIKVLHDPQETVPYRLELALLLEQDPHAEISSRARKVYEDLINIDPKQHQAVQSLAQIYRNEEDWLEATKLYEQLSQDETRAQSPDIWQDLVWLYAKTEQSHAQEKALAQLLARFPHFGKAETQSIPSLQQAQPELARARALYVLAQHYKEANLALGAAKVLANIDPTLAGQSLEMGLQFDPLAPELWRYRLHHAQGSERPALWQRMAQQYSQHPHSDDAMQSLDRMVEDLLSDGLTLQDFKQGYTQLKQDNLSLPPLARVLANLLESEDQLDQAVQVRQELLASLPRGLERTNLQFEMAIQQLRLLNNREEGRQLLWQIINEAPGHMDAFYELQQLYEEEEALPAFVEQLEKSAHQAPPGPERADLYFRAFELQRDMLGDTDGARALVTRAQAEAATDVETLQTLAAAYEELAALEEAATLYEELGKQAKGEAQIRALERASELYHRDLDQPDRAIDTAVLLRTHDTGNQAAFALLQELYESLWMWNELAELYKVQVEEINDKSQRSEMLFNLAEIHINHMEDYEGALDAYRSALRANPKNVKILRSLQALYEELEDWPAVVGALKAISRVEVDQEQLFEIYIQIAILSLDRLYRLEDTEKYYQLAHTQLPERDDALHGLIDFYDATENWESLAKAAVQYAVVLQKQSRQEEVQEQLKRMIQALDRIEDAPSAKLTPESFLREELNERQESALLTRQLLDLLREHTNSGIDSSFALTRTLYQQQLQELSWLAQLWESEDPVSIDEAFKEQLLNAMYDESWEALGQRLQELNQQSQNSEDIASYYLALSELQLRKLSDLGGAQQSAAQALQLGCPPERALQVIEQAMLLQDAFDADVLLAHAQNLQQEEEQARAFSHLGQYFLLQQQPSQALRCYLAATAALSPESATGLAKQFLELHHDTWLQSPIDAARTQLSDDMEAETKTLLEAWLCFNHQQTEAAINALTQVIEQTPDSLPALRLLGAHYAAAQEWEYASYYLYRYLELEWERLSYDEVAELCIQLANIAQQQQDWDNALYYLEQGAKFVPEEHRVFQAQIEVYHNSHDWDGLVGFYRDRIEEPEPTDDIGQIWYDLGEVYRTYLNNPAQAKTAFERALQYTPDHVQAAQALAQLNQQANVDLLASPAAQVSV